MRSKIIGLAIGSALLLRRRRRGRIMRSRRKFDGNKPVKLRGTVTKMEWINPHAWIHIDVKEAGRQGDQLDGGMRQPQYAAAPRRQQELGDGGDGDCWSTAISRRTVRIKPMAAT